MIWIVSSTSPLKKFFFTLSCSQLVIMHAHGGIMGLLFSMKAEKTRFVLGHITVKLKELKIIKFHLTVSGFLRITNMWNAVIIWVIGQSENRGIHPVNEWIYCSHRQISHKLLHRSPPLSSSYDSTVFHYGFILFLESFAKNYSFSEGAGWWKRSLRMDNSGKRELDHMSCWIILQMFRGHIVISDWEETAAGGCLTCWTGAYEFCPIGASKSFMQYSQYTGNIHQCIIVTSISAFIRHRSNKRQHLFVCLKGNHVTSCEPFGSPAFLILPSDGIIQPSCPNIPQLSPNEVPVAYPLLLMPPEIEMSIWWSFYEPPTLFQKNFHWNQ